MKSTKHRSFDITDNRIYPFEIFYLDTFGASACDYDSVAKTCVAKTIKTVKAIRNDLISLAKMLG
nr:hypothetical protein [Desulfogranum marinum]